MRFSSAATDPDGDQLLITWAFGDGTQGAGRNATHTYTTPGTYDATVTVRDAGGLTATDTVVVTVGNRAPTVELTATPQSGSAPLNVSVSAAGSDPNGDALTYRFSFGAGEADAGR